MNAPVRLCCSTVQTIHRRCSAGSNSNGSSPRRWSIPDGWYPFRHPKTVHIIRQESERETFMKRVHFHRTLIGLVDRDFVDPPRITSIQTITRRTGDFRENTHQFLRARLSPVRNPINVHTLSVIHEISFRVCVCLFIVSSILTHL